MKGAGIPKDKIDAYEAAIASGAPLDSVMSAYEISQTAEEVRKTQNEAAETAARNITEANAILPTLTPSTPSYFAATRAAQTGENYFELLKTYNDGSGAGAATPANVAEAQALVDAGTVNPATNQPFTLPEALGATVLPIPPAARGAGPNVTILPDGTVQVTNQPPAAGTPPVAPVDGASSGITDFGQTPAGTVTATDAAGNVINAPIPGAIAPQQAVVDLEQARVDLERSINTMPAGQAKLEAEAQLAQVNARLAEAKLVADEQAAAQLAEDAAKQNSEEYLGAQRQFSAFSESAQKIVDTASSIWATGLLGGVANTLGQLVDTPTTRSTLLANARRLGAQAMLDALISAKEAGVSLTPVSNVDLQVLGASSSLLAAPEDLQSDALLKEVTFQSNYLKDALDGPRDLTRLDDFGQPYQVGPDTLGVTPDTFDRHWLFIPPDVKAAWAAGELPALPVDDPAYAEAANVVNAMVRNYELYQGPLDRTVVGTVGSTSPADIPPPPATPEGVDPASWPSLWQAMTDEERALWQE
jgi:hypothetical protein